MGEVDTLLGTLTKLEQTPQSEVDSLLGRLPALEVYLEPKPDTTTAAKIPSTFSEKMAALAALQPPENFPESFSTISELPRALIEGTPGLIGAVAELPPRALRGLAQLGAIGIGGPVAESLKILGEQRIIPIPGVSERLYEAGKWIEEEAIRPLEQLTVAEQQARQMQQQAITSFAAAGPGWQAVAGTGQQLLQSAAFIAALGASGAMMLPPGLAATPNASVAQNVLNIGTNAFRIGATTAAFTPGSPEERIKAGLIATLYPGTPALSGMIPSSIGAKVADIGLNQLITHALRLIDPATKESWYKDPQLGAAFLMDVLMSLSTQPLRKLTPAMTQQQAEYHITRLIKQQAEHKIRIEPPVVTKPVEPPPVTPVTPVAPVPEVAPKVEVPAKVEVAPAAAQEVPKVPIEGEPSSIKNAFTEAARERLGVEPGRISEPTPTDIAAEYAKARIAENPRVARELEVELRNTGRSVDENDIALLAIRGRELANREQEVLTRLLQAKRENNYGKIAIAEADLKLVTAESEPFYDLTKAFGREQSLAFSARYRHALLPDFSLTAVERRFEVKHGQPPTAKQHVKIVDATARIAELEKQLSAAETKGDPTQKLIAEAISATRVSRVRPTLDPKSPRYGSRNRIVTRERYTAAVGRIQSGTIARDITGVLTDLVEIGTFHLEAGMRDFASWSSTMLETVGGKYKSHFADIYKKSQSRFQPEERNRIIGNLADKVDNGELIGLQAREIAKSFITEGFTEREAVVTETYKVLQQIIPEITRRETADAISGYGIYRQLSKDEVSVQLRAISGELQQLSKLEDMQKGKAPSKTGIERRIPSDEERRLTQKVDEAKKRGGFTVTDPEVQLKSALDEVKTRLTHQITDLETQISTGEKIVKTKMTIELDAEAVALKARRDELKTQYGEIFGQPKHAISDAQRIKMATAAVEKSITEYERRIQAKDLFPGKPIKKTPTTPELDALKSRRDALHEELKLLQDIVRPKLTPEQRAQQAYKTHTMNRIAELKAKLASEDYSKEPSRPKRELTQDEVTLRNERERLQWELTQLQKPPAQRAWEYAQEGGRLARTIASGDWSYIGRQLRPVLAHDIGNLLIGKPTVTWWKAAKANVYSFCSQEKYDAAMKDLKESPYYQEQLKYGLWTDMGESIRPTMREELAPSKWAGKIPLVKQGNRAAIIAGNAARDLLYRELAPRWEAKGKLKTEAAHRRLAKLIGDLTGRGVLPRGETIRVIAELSNDFIFGPRFTLSRVKNTATLFHTLSLHPEVSVEGAKTLVGTVAMVGTVIGIYNTLNGDNEDVILNPLSPDFAKIKIGDTRFELLEGHAPVIRLLAQLATGKSMVRGKVRDIDREQVVYRFIRSKRAPLIGLISELLTGKNYAGQEIEGVAGWSNAAKDAILFMWVSSAIDAFQSEYRDNKDTISALGMGTTVGAAEFVGVGAQTYEKKKITRPQVAD